MYLKTIVFCDCGVVDSAQVNILFSLLKHLIFIICYQYRQTHKGFRNQLGGRFWMCELDLYEPSSF